MGKHFIFGKSSENREDFVGEQLNALEKAMGDAQTPKDTKPSNPPDSSLAASCSHVQTSTKSSCLASGVVIKGSVNSVSSIKIFGEITGDVDCKDDVVLNGKINGNITASEVHMLGGLVNGDISCTGNVMLSNGSRVKGNITGDSLNCDGWLGGNIKLKSKAAILKNAGICGDITAERISIEEGATVNGKVATTARHSDEGQGSDLKPEKNESNHDTEENKILAE